MAAAEDQPQASSSPDPRFFCCSRANVGLFGLFVPQPLPGAHYPIRDGVCRVLSALSGHLCGS